MLFASALVDSENSIKVVNRTLLAPAGIWADPLPGEGMLCRSLRCSVTPKLFDDCVASAEASRLSTEPRCNRGIL